MFADRLVEDSIPRIVSQGLHQANLNFLCEVSRSSQTILNRRQVFAEISHNMHWGQIGGRTGNSMSI